MGTFPALLNKNAPCKPCVPPPTFIACVAAELSVTHLRAKTQTKFVKRVAKKLTAILACYLAGEVASILSPVAAVGHREMVAPMYHPLLTPVFWARPIYMELLHASSRLRRDTRVETVRPSTGLVKILCSPKMQGVEPINATPHNKGLAHWLGAVCHAQSLYVWVPAHWAPCICTVVKNRTTQFDMKRDHETLVARAWGHEVEQQAQRDGAGIANATVVEGVAYFLRAVDLRPGVEDIPSLVISIRAPWLELPVAEFVNTMQTIYQGVLDGIFCQRPMAAWFSAQCKRIQMTIILPSSSRLDVWQSTLLRHTSCWPFRLPQTMADVRPPSKATFVRLRKRVQSKHILGGLEINWDLIEQHLWMDGPPILSRAELENQLFLLRSGSTTAATYKGHDSEKWRPWTQRRNSLWWGRTNSPPALTLRMSAWILWGCTNHQSYLDWLAHVEQQQVQTGRFKTKKGYWIVKRRLQT